MSPVGPLDAAKMSAALDGVTATGWTPLAAAITKAGESLGQNLGPASAEGEQAVFVVSDGLETCGGDPVAAAKALHQSGVKAVVNIIGFDIPQKQRKALEAVAEAGGGLFTHVASRRELEERLRIESANLGERVAYDSAAITVKNANDTSVLGATNRADSCVLQITNGEASRFLELSNRMVADGQTEGDSAREAYDRLKERHEVLKAQMRAFRDRAKSELEAVNTRIEQERERVKAAYGQK